MPDWWPANPAKPAKRGCMGPREPRFSVMATAAATQMAPAADSDGCALDGVGAWELTQLFQAAPRLNHGVRSRPASFVG